QEFHAHLRVELAFAFLPRTEGIGFFGDAQMACRRHDVEQDLETHGGELVRDLVETVAAHGEEAAHRIADRRTQRDAGERGGKTADETAPLTEGRRAA